MIFFSFARIEANLTKIILGSVVVIIITSLLFIFANGENWKFSSYGWCSCGQRTLLLIHTIVRIIILDADCFTSLLHLLTT